MASYNHGKVSSILLILEGSIFGYTPVVHVLHADNYKKEIDAIHDFTDDDIIFHTCDELMTLHKVTWEEFFQKIIDASKAKSNKTLLRFT